MRGRKRRARAGRAVRPETAEAAPPRTPWGHPDLQGVWDYRTITPLERPEELGDRAFLTEEEAAELELEAVSRVERLAEPSVIRTEPLPAGGSVGSYNDFWFDRGVNIVESRRTSLIVDPPNGRIPALTPEGQRRVGERAAARARPAITWEDRSLFERCVTPRIAAPARRLQPEPAESCRRPSTS